MNESDFHLNQLDPLEQLKVRIIAYLHGECSDFEREALEESIHSDEKVAFHFDHLLQAHVELLAQTSGEVLDGWQLPASSRQQLLGQLRPSSTAPGNAASNREAGKPGEPKAKFLDSNNSDQANVPLRKQPRTWSRFALHGVLAASIIFAAGWLSLLSVDSKFSKAMPSLSLALNADQDSGVWEEEDFFASSSEFSRDSSSPAGESLPPSYYMPSGEVEYFLAPSAETSMESREIEKFNQLRSRISERTPSLVERGKAESKPSVTFVEPNRGATSAQSRLWFDAAAGRPAVPGSKGEITEPNDASKFGRFDDSDSPGVRRPIVGRGGSSEVNNGQDNSSSLLAMESVTSPKVASSLSSDANQPSSGAGFGNSSGSAGFGAGMGGMGYGGPGGGSGSPGAGMSGPGAGMGEMGGGMGGQGVEFSGGMGGGNAGVPTGGYGGAETRFSYRDAEGIEFGDRLSGLAENEALSRQLDHDSDGVVGSDDPIGEEQGPQIASVDSKLGDASGEEFYGGTKLEFEQLADRNAIDKNDSLGRAESNGVVSLGIIPQNLVGGRPGISDQPEVALGATPRIIISDELEESRVLTEASRGLDLSAAKELDASETVEEEFARGFESQLSSNEALGSGEPVEAETSATVEPFSTFSLHVSDVSFQLAYDALSNGEWPNRESIRIDEFVNAMDYRDPLPDPNQKVACVIEQAAHPFKMQRNLLRISLSTAAHGRSTSTPLHLTLLLDNSGSMDRLDRRQTLERAFQTLAEQLTENDKITLISFANRPRLLADQLPGDQAGELVDIVRKLPSEGGTNIEEAIRLAGEKAQQQWSVQAQNRIVMLTDGAVNLGNADPEKLAARIVALRDQGIAFDAAGIVARELNDTVLESLTRNGDGRYYLLNSMESAGQQFSDQIAGAFRPFAKNVKVQVEFNPMRVGRYRLLGFEEHRLNQEDFRNDQVDAAEMASAEAGVALYQVEPIIHGTGDIGAVSVRFRDLSSGEMVERRWPIPFVSNCVAVDQATSSIRLATCAAMLAMKLKQSSDASSIRLEDIAMMLAQLPTHDQNHPRVVQLREMIEATRQLLP